MQEFLNSVTFCWGLFNTWVLSPLFKNVPLLKSLVDQVAAFAGYLNENKWTIIKFILAVVVILIVTFGIAIMAYTGLSLILVPQMYSEYPLVFPPAKPGSDRRVVNVAVNDLSRNTVYRHAWDLTLHMPETADNMRAEKLVGVQWGQDGDTVLRTLTLKWKSWGRLWIERIVWAVPMAFGFVDEAQVVTVNLDERNLGFQSTVKVFLDASVHYYTALLTATGKLSGLTYYWYHWRFTTMLIFIACVWSFLGIVGLVVFIIKFYVLDTDPNELQRKLKYAKMKKKQSRQNKNKQEQHGGKNGEIIRKQNTPAEVLSKKKDAVRKREPIKDEDKKN